MSSKDDLAFFSLLLKGNLISVILEGTVFQLGALLSVSSLVLRGKWRGQTGILASKCSLEQLYLFTGSLARSPFVLKHTTKDFFPFLKLVLVDKLVNKGI